MPSTKLKEKSEELTAKQKKLKAIFDEAGPDRDFSKVKSVEGDTKSKIDKIHQMSAELNDLFDEVKALDIEEENERRLKEVEIYLNTPRAPILQPHGQALKSIGQMFVESESYKANVKGGKVIGSFDMTLDIGLKAQFGESAGWPPQSLRIPGLVIPYATQPVVLMDIIPPGVTTYQLVKYMEETTFTNAAAEVAEGGSYPEASLALTERSATVEKVTVTLPVTDEQLADVPQAESYVNQRLPFMLRQRVDSQLIAGAGSGSTQLLGLSNLAGTGSYAKTGGDSDADAIYKAMTKVSFTAFAIPSHVLMHPNAWQAIRLLRTTDGLYIWGMPQEIGPERIWGLPVIRSTFVTDNLAWVGDFTNFSQLYERTGVDIQVGYVNDDFIKGRRAIRGDTRLAMVWYRPSAFVQATGLSG